MFCTIYARPTQRKNATNSAELRDQLSGADSGMRDQLSGGARPTQRSSKAKYLKNMVRRESESATNSAELNL
jgi:hypothetical protein